MRTFITLFIALALTLSASACQRGVKIAQILKDPTVEMPEHSKSEEEE